MAQVTVHLPEDGLTAARKCVRENRPSLPAGAGEGAGARIREAATADRPGSLGHLPHHGAGGLVEPDDPPPEDPDLFRNCFQERRS